MIATLMDARIARPWHRLHWSTWLATAIVAASGVWCQLNDTGAVVQHLETYTSRGWPTAHVFHTGPPVKLNRVIRDRLLVNVLVCAAIAAATGFCFEHWARRLWRFRLSSLFALMAVAAVLTRYGHQVLQRLPAAVETPLTFGTGCAIFVAGWMAVGILLTIGKCVRHWRQRLRTTIRSSP